MIKTDLLVIGGGPGGYTAAIRAAQLGRKTMLIEKNKLGGVCLNRGCIPTKVYLKAAKLLCDLEKTSLFGIKVDGYEVDIAALRCRKEKIVSTLVNGVRGLLKANNVEIKQGSARFKANNIVVVNGKEEVEAKKIIIATGAEEIKLKIPGVDLGEVINSDEALELKKIPQSIAIIGGGVIGVEFAEIYHRFGSEVTIFEALPRILPLEDLAVSEELKRSYIEKGVKIYTSSSVQEIRRTGNEKEILYNIDGRQSSLKAEQVLVAVGRRINVSDLGLENTGIDFDSKGIKVNRYLQTTVSNVYAVGDVSGGMQLAHVAFYEGEKAAEHIAGQSLEVDYKVVPRCIFSVPEVASVGLTEQEVKEMGCDYRIGQFPFRANGKAILMEESTGFVKMIVAREHNEILGIHFIGPSASELITEAALAIKLECTVEEIIETIHAHPTVGESYREVAMDVLGRAIHFKR